MEAEPQSVEVKKRKDEMGISKNQYMEDMAGNRWNAKMDVGREKLASEGEVTSQAGSGSRNLEMEAERRSTEVAPVIEEVNEEVSPIEEKIKKSTKLLLGKIFQASKRKEAL